MEPPWMDGESAGDEIWGAGGSDEAGGGEGGSGQGGRSTPPISTAAPQQYPTTSASGEAAQQPSVGLRVAAALRDRHERMLQALGTGSIEPASPAAAAALSPWQALPAHTRRRRRHRRPAPHDRVPRSHVLPYLPDYEDESEGEVERQRQAARDRRNAYAAAAIGATAPVVPVATAAAGAAQQGAAAAGDGGSAGGSAAAAPLGQLQATAAAVGHRTAAFVEESLDEWWHFGVGGADGAHPSTSGPARPSLGELLFGDFPSLPGPFAARRASGSGSGAGTLLRLPSGLMRGALAPFDPAWWTANPVAPRAPRKPLGLKLAELALPKDLLGVAETIQKDILEADQPLGPAVIVFLLRSLASVAQDWADANLDKVFGVFAIYTMVSCGIVALGKRAAKRAARAFAVPSPALLLRWLRRAGAALPLPARLRRRLPQRKHAGGGGAELVAAVVGQGDDHNPKERWLHPLATPVAVITDYLMPTQFFGPYLCAYVTARVLVSTAIARRQLEAAEDEAVEAAFGQQPAAAAPATAADSTSKGQQQQQQQQGSGAGSRPRRRSQGARSGRLQQGPVTAGAPQAGGAASTSGAAQGTGERSGDSGGEGEGDEEDYVFESQEDSNAAPAAAGGIEPLLPSVEVASRALRDAAARAATTLSTLQPLSLLTTAGGGGGAPVVPEVEMAHRGASAFAAVQSPGAAAAGAAAGGAQAAFAGGSSRKAASAGPSRAASPAPVAPAASGLRRGNSFGDFVGGG